MTTHITLAEYERRAVPLTEAEARALASAGRDRLRVRATGNQGEYEVEATQHVGTIVVGDLSVLIRPKVPLENVFLLLEAGEPDWRDEDYSWETAGGLLPAFAAFFARTAERVLAAGVHRAYRAEEERLPAIRGRVDFVAQLRRPGLVVPVPCRFEEFTADVAENQILRAAVRRLLQTPGIDPPTRRQLHHLLVRLDEVADVYVEPDDVDRIHFTRLNERYEPALRLAQLVLRNLTLLDRSGARAASSFLVDMNALFQSFVTLRLRRLLRRRLEVLDEPPGYRLGRGRKVVLRPDLVFTRGQEVVFVADTKYKLLGDQLGRNDDYYQILAYTTALDLRDGVLIYCSSDGGELDRCVEVVHTDKRLWTYRVDLSGSATDVDASLRALGDWITHHAGSRSLRSA